MSSAQIHPFDDLEGKDIFSHPAFKTVTQGANYPSHPGLTVDSLQRQTLFKSIEEDVNLSNRIMGQMKADHHRWMQLRLHIALKKACLSPLRKIPPELLGRVFALLAEDLPFNASFLTQIMLVCRFWRDVAIANPALWVNLNYRDHGMTFRLPDARPVSLWLERTQGKLFNVHAYLCDNLAFMHAIHPHAHRMRSLDIRIGPTGVAGNALKLIFSRAESLESLCVRGPEYNVHQFSRVAKSWWFKINAPKLTHLELDRCGYRSKLFSPNLESLTLIGIEFGNNTMFELSQLAPNLKHLTVHRCSDIDEPSEKPVIMSSLQTLEIKDMWPSADSIIEWCQLTGVWDILNGASSLNKLMVRILSDDLCGWHTPLRHLTELHVDFCRPYKKEDDWNGVDNELLGITHWNNNMPALQRLTICGTRYRTYANCNGLMDALLESPPIFPLLEELILNCCVANVDTLLNFSWGRSPSDPAEANPPFKPCRITMLDWEELPDVESAFADQLEAELEEAGY